VVRGWRHRLRSLRFSTYALFQSITTTANLPSVLAARSAALIVASPLGTAIGGSIVAALAFARSPAGFDGKEGVDGSSPPSPYRGSGAAGLAPEARSRPGRGV
jgi:hypothetical protein